MARRHHHPRQPRMSEEMKILYHIAEIFTKERPGSSSDEPKLDENKLKDMMETPDISDMHGVIDLYCTLYAFTDGNAMIRKDNKRILSRFPTTDDEGENIMAKQYIRSGFDHVEQTDHGRNRHFAAKEPAKNGDITVEMTDGLFTHKFIVTSEAIRGFYYAHPIQGRFAVAEVIQTIRKKIVDFSCAIINEQLILKDHCRETIRSVYTQKYDDERIKTWVFQTDYDDDGDVINRAYGDEVRYIAFMEAFRKATCDATRGGVYEWLYKAICYSNSVA